MNKSTPTTNQLLQALSQSLAAIAQEIRLQHAHDYTCLTPALDKVLAITGRQRAVNVKDLASLLLITSGAATQHVAALEKQGMVTRVMSPQDRREIIIELTEPGKATYKLIQANKLRLMAVMFSPLSKTELQTLVDLMDKVSQPPAKTS